MYFISISLYFRLSDDEDQASGMTDKEKSAQGKLSSTVGSQLTLKIHC